jgi:hypothetical protein
VSVYEIRLFLENGDVETHWVDGPVRTGGRLKIDGRRSIVLKRVRPSRRDADGAFVCLEVPAPQTGSSQVRRAA